MVTRMDREIGRLVALIRELGLEEQTIFVFTSDNGPTYDRLGGSDSEFFQSAAGMRGLKGFLYEGGVRVPAMVRWKGHLPAGRVLDRVSGFEDWMPTLLELVGHAEAVPAGIDGISFAPSLRGEPQPPRPFLYREFAGYGGQQALWQWPWKAICQNLRRKGPRAGAQSPIELYHLEQDPAEQHDLAAVYPERVRAMAALMRQQHTPSPEFPIPALDQPAAAP